MRRLTLIILFVMPLMLFAQSFDQLWKQVEKAEQQDLPQTRQQLLQKITQKADREKAYGHLLKSELMRMQAAAEVSMDSLKPEVERMQQREQHVKDAALRAVYQALLGILFEQHQGLTEQASEKARQYMDKALANPVQLASVRIDGYKPLVQQGADGAIFQHNLLGLLGMETKRYDVLHRYYEKSGNRAAAMMSALYELNQQCPQDVEPLWQSRHVKRLDSLMTQYADLRECAEVAIERFFYMDSHTDATLQQKWNYLEQALHRWQGWPRMEVLRNQQKIMKALNLSVSLQQLVNIPSATCQVRLEDLRGISQITMRVYRVNATARDLAGIYVENEKGYNKIRKYLVAMPDKTQKRTYTDKAPYENYQDEMTLGTLPVGVYMLEFESSPRTEHVVRMMYFVSDLRVLVQEYPDHKMHYVVVNATTGHPVSGARLTITKNQAQTILTTNEKGECEYASRQNITLFYVTTDDDQACPAMNTFGYFSYYSQDPVSHHVNIFTDRAIYRPGQTVHASAILYQTEDGYRHSVEKNKKVTIVLRDANQQEIGRQDVVTDDYGTCATTFVLPRQGLTGVYRILVDGHSQAFRVETYKRPTFEVNIPAVKERYADGDTLQVKGTALTYAGVPVTGATVRYKVERRCAFWWLSYARYWHQGTLASDHADEQVAGGEVMTAQDGSFTVPVPLVLPHTRYPMFYQFVLTADVTDQAGETHHGELVLPLGNRLTAFTMDMPEKIRVDEPACVTFHLRNAASNDLDAPVRYRWTQEGKRSQNWRQAQTNKPVALPSMKSGRYQLEAICGTDTLAQSFVVFSLDDKRPAVTTDDWFYISDTQFPNDGKPVTLQVGSSDEQVHMVYTIFSGDQLLESGTIRQSDALWNRKFTYREAYGNGVLITVAWVKQGKTYSHEATIQRPVPDQMLRLKWDTFRDRLEPGQQETWTLSVVRPDGQPANAQLLATLYDKSLDQLAPHNWSLQPHIWLPTASTRWRGASWSTPYGAASFMEPLAKVNELCFDAFDRSVFPVYLQTFGRFYPVRRSFSSPMMKGEKVFLLAEKVVNMADEASVEESEPVAQDASPQVRENLQETAFFYPQLHTDQEGRVQLTFTLPESLTTWRFMGVAHTQDMMTGLLTGETVASKTVMIQPHVPRFVRVGDRATVSARIFNTSSHEVRGVARLQLVDAENSQVIYAEEHPVSMMADDMQTVLFNYDVKDDDHHLLIARVTVSGDDFSDGEQHYLPILPHQERVTVTIPFTQHEPGVKTVDLAGLKPETAVGPTLMTVEYTNNPAWLMIQSLPAVGHPYDHCALCQATALYAQLIGRHILQQNPQVRQVLEAWSRERGQETSLMSSLQKNEELKDLLLTETPWVMDAQQETEQKARLADFFDVNQMNERLKSAMDHLTQLQQGDGSWSWWPGMKGSLCMTVEVSELLVRLNRMTGQQTETAEMLTKAFTYMSDEMVRMVAEMKKAEKKGLKQTFPSRQALQWLYICMLDGRTLSPDVQQANAYLKALLKKETHNQSIYDKAMSAIVLNNKTYVKSLKEYTVYRDDMGRYYDTPRAHYTWRNYRIPTQVAAIEALQRLTPEDTQTIEEMQRWLLQERRNQTRDTPVNSADAVYAFLNGRQQVLQAQSATVLRVDGQPLHTSEATAGIGYVKTTIAGDDKHLLTAEKSSAGTSWGAVYMQFMQPTADVQTQHQGISVRRDILGVAADGLLHVGDRIRVRITIEADRDYDFVQVIDKRAACMEPVSQQSGYRWGYYYASQDTSTNYYFDLLPKGQHVIETEYYIDRVGTYDTGTCTASCAYSPEYRGTAKSLTLEVK